MRSVYLEFGFHPTPATQNPLESSLRPFPALRRSTLPDLLGIIIANFNAESSKTQKRVAPLSLANAESTAQSPSSSLTGLHLRRLVFWQSAESHLTLNKRFIPGSGIPFSSLRCFLICSHFCISLICSISFALRFWLLEGCWLITPFCPWFCCCIWPVITRTEGNGGSER